MPTTTAVLILTAAATILAFAQPRADEVESTHCWQRHSLQRTLRCRRHRPLRDGRVRVTGTALWPLSIQEQFHPRLAAAFLAISVTIASKGRAQARRTLLAAGVIGVIVATSFGWAIYETATSPTWPYFNT